MTPRRALLKGVVLLPFLPLLGCGPTEQPAPPEPTPLPLPTLRAPTPITLAAAPRERIEALVFLDANPNYPQDLRDRARAELADELEARVLPGSGGFRFVILRLADDVYAPEAELLRIEAPGLPRPPEPPSLSPPPRHAPTPTSSPYGDPSAQKAASAELDAAYARAVAAWQQQCTARLAAHEEAVQRYLAQLEEARKRVETQTARLRDLKVRPGRPADHEAALALVRDVFRDRAGLTLALFVSGLEAGPINGPRDGLSLTGIEVAAVYFHAPAPAIGDARVQAARERLSAAGAGLVVCHPSSGWKEVLL